jgi:hypothetical protein
VPQRGFLLRADQMALATTTEAQVLGQERWEAGRSQRGNMSLRDPNVFRAGEPLLGDPSALGWALYVTWALPSLWMTHSFPPMDLRHLR